MDSLTIKSHIGDEYTVVKESIPKEYYTIYKPKDTWRISKQYDMEIRVGGMRMYINADGTMVSGCNTFDKEDLEKVYQYLKNT